MRQRRVGEHGARGIEDEHGQTRCVGEEVRREVREHGGIIERQARLIVLTPPLLIGGTTRHPHRFSLLRRYTTQGEFFECPNGHSWDIPPALHCLRRCAAPQTILVVGHIGVILVRKETQRQGVKSVVVQGLVHAPM